MEKSKKIIYAIIALAALVLIAYGISRGMEGRLGTGNGNDRASDPCSVDISAIILDDPEGLLSSQEDVARAMFDNYFEEYTKIPNCPEAGINGYNLVSISNVQDLQEGHFTADIIFDLQPISMEETEWITEEATIDGNWIRGKEGTLSIMRTEGGYFLVVY